MYGGGDAEAAWKVGRIMLRFRPIAPKPAAGSSGPPTADAPAPRRPKRRGPSNAAGRPRGRRRRKIEAAKPSPPEDDDRTLSTADIVTLPLMPETPERKHEDPGEAPKESLPRSDHSHPSPAPSVPAEMGWVALAAAAAATARPRAVESRVTVECVTDTWREGEVAWRSDEAVRAALTADDYPGFVSDGWGQVTWSNEAYRRMVGAAGEGAGGGGWAEEEEELQVSLEAPRGLVTAPCRAFTCGVRVQYARLPRGTKRSVAAPCDVWRLDCGGWAWRLDMKAALRLAL